MLKGKTVVLGITGSIAAYKMANVASSLAKMHCDVQVIMTKNATQFITPLTFETLCNSRCMVDTFDRNFQYSVEHVALAKRADLVLVAPATANIIAKMAHGLADDMLSTTVLACHCPKLVAPAMNTNMLNNPITRDNLATLQRYGFEIIQPAVGMLACKDVGAGKLPDEQLLVAHILQHILRPKTMAGKKVLITAGPTCEPLDPVRYMTNHSSGKMGYALAKECSLRGAQVTLVTGKTALQPWPFVQTVEIQTAQQMFEEVTSRAPQMDIIIKAAAVADYRPKAVADQKLKKSDGELSLELERTQDILKYLGEHKPDGQFLCGFSMETENLLENSRAKLAKKNADMMVANNLKEQGAGFAGDTNIVTIITGDSVKALPLMTKEETAGQIIDEILTCDWSSDVCSSDLRTTDGRRCWKRYTSPRRIPCISWEMWSTGDHMGSKSCRKSCVHPT